MAFNQYQIDECYRLYNSINQADNLKKYILILWVTERRRDKLSGYFKYLGKLPPELIRELSDFVLQRFNCGNYYTIEDNYNRDYSYKNKNYRSFYNKWFLTRPKKYIGKILTKKIKLSPKLVIKKIIRYLEKPDLTPFLIFVLRNINKVQYFVSYLDWENNFNEYIYRKQISLIDRSGLDYLLNLRPGSFLDCKHPYNAKYYRGMVTHIHFHHNKIIGVDVIIVCKWGIRYSYIHQCAIPIFSSKIARKNLHINNEYLSFLRYQLSWAYITFKEEEDKYYNKSNSLIEYIDVIKGVNVSFGFKDVAAPKWRSLIKRRLFKELEDLMVHDPLYYTTDEMPPNNDSLTRLKRVVNLLEFGRRRPIS